MKIPTLLRTMAGAVFVAASVMGYQYAGAVGLAAGALVGLFSGVWFLVAQEVLQYLQRITEALTKSMPTTGQEELPAEPARPVAYGVNPQVPAPQRVLSPHEVAETVAAMRAAQPKYRG